MSILGIRSHFSVGQSTLKPKKIVEIAKDKGYETVAICDRFTVAGMTELVKACKGSDIDYIIGATLDVFENADERIKERSVYSIKAFVMTEQGLKNLFKLISKAYSQDRFYYTPRLGLDDILGADLDGLVFTTGDINGLFSYDDYQGVLDSFDKLQPGIDVYLEAPLVKQPYYNRIRELALQEHRDKGRKMIATRPVLYAESQDVARDIAQAVVSNSNPNSDMAPKPFERAFHLMDVEDWGHVVRQFPDIKDCTEEIIDACVYHWEKHDMSLPKLATDEFAALVKLCKEGWADRLHNKVFGETLDKSRLTEYKDRLKNELGVIKNMGFSAYFLLVHYVVNYSKDNDILVGPARGSAAGSLVAYLLKITDVDPLRFGLIFERFLNPDRLDYPDIDLDFMSSRRGEIIDHLIDKFGSENVVGIANYNTLGAASALRDVARVSQLPPTEYECSKLVPKEHGQSVDLEEAVKQVTQIENFCLRYPREWKSACELQGVVRATGQHAAGVVVAGEPVVERGAVYGNKDYPVVCWDKRVVEDWGLIKLDVLGLSTLDIIKLALDKIEQHTGKKVDLWQIPLDDKETLAIFEKGRTKGVFQFEGGMARSLCRDIAVAGDFSFNDIVAINALNRPGPLEAGLTEKYVKIRQKKLSPEYPHPSTEDALGETEGVIVYQEQVMQIARDLCGFTMAEADTLRKAIGKKDADLMKTMEEQFVEGAVKNSMFESDAINLWQAIEGFAAYSFNKSHSLAYSLVSYMAAYLKAHYAGHFYAASMSVLDDDKVKLLAKEATTDGFIVMPPNINNSTASFEMQWDAKRACNVLYSPLTAVKNVSAKVCQHIMEKRTEHGGAFSDYQHFFDSVEARKCNKRAKENLDKVGAFACIEPTQQDPLHPDRLRDQKELMGALAVSDVKPDRRIDISPVVEKMLSDIYDRADAMGKPSVRPTHGKKPKFMVVTDKPHFFEVQEGKSFDTKSSKYVREALKQAGLKPSEGYYTSLIKAQPDDPKNPTREEIDTYGEFLKEEIDALDPPLIILAGTKSIRYFFPDSKGSAEDLSTTVEYDKVKDRNYMFCLSPQMVYVKPEKQEVLNGVFEAVAELLE